MRGFSVAEQRSYGFEHTQRATVELNLLQLFAVSDFIFLKPWNRPPAAASKGCVTGCIVTTGPIAKEPTMCQKTVSSQPLRTVSLLLMAAFMLALLLSAAPVPGDEVKVEARPGEKVTITIEKPKPGDAPHICVAPPPVKPAFEGVRPSIDLAILLDTSNSMDGLINQAKQQVWTIVNQFAAAKKNGQTPVLRVALFQYGNNGLPASEGYIRQMVPLTDNLDDLSAALFALTTNGGSEYCGQVIGTAVQALDWSNEPGAYRAIFIAGNEPFTQGPVAYQDACKQAIEKGIVVNTIHCGDYNTGISGSWQAGAQMAEGDYLNIDSDRKVVHVTAPQDKVIIELNRKLNQTYIWYGERADQMRLRQEKQDRNAAKLSSSVAVERARVKASGAGGQYANVNRDLVDTYEADNEALAGVAPEALPEPMRKMNEAERKAYVEQMAQKRAAIQKQIKELTAEREAYVAAERQKRADQAKQAGEDTLGDAVTRAIQKQLKDAGFRVDAE